MSDWLTDELKQETRKVFEPRYNRKLTDGEVIEIAENLEAVVEEILKLKWKQKYANNSTASKTEVGTKR